MLKCPHCDNFYPLDQGDGEYYCQNCDRSFIWYSPLQKLQTALKFTDEQMQNFNDYLEGKIDTAIDHYNIAH